MSGKIRTWFYSCAANAAVKKYSLQCDLTNIFFHSAHNAQYVFIRLCGAHAVN